MTDNWFSYLQGQICKEFEFLENKKFKFSKRDWKKKKIKEGGGTSYLLSGGKIFDKVGVNKSTVSGVFPKQFRSKIFGAEKKGTYWASGISVVAHMRNPKIPAIHFNTRFIVTSKEWFGGGMDATPSYNDNKEAKIIHNDLKKVCLQNKKNYKNYKKWCDDYFYLPHRKEPRGIGGIFFATPTPATPARPSSSTASSCRRSTTSAASSAPSAAAAQLGAASGGTPRTDAPTHDASVKAARASGPT